MGVKVTTTSGIDVVGGSQDSSIKDYSVSVDATTQNPGNYLGGTTRASVGVSSSVDTYLAYGEEATLTDSVRGVALTGDISSVGESNYVGMSLTIDSRLARLNVDGKIAPQTSVPLATVVSRYLTAGTVGTSVTAPYNPTVTVPGFAGNLLDGLKQVLSAFGAYLEDSEGGVLYLRQLGADTGTLPENLVTVGREVSGQSLTHRVDINYYNWTAITNRQVYPYTLDSPMVITVNAEETQRFEFKLNASLSSVDQPIAVNTINLSTVDYFGQYAVVSSAGVPIPAAEWLGQGGKLEVRLIAHDTIEVIVTGMRENWHIGPYRIAEYGSSAGVGDFPALYITGTGVRSNVVTLPLYTGSSKASVDSVQTVDNLNISTAQQAFDRGQWAVAEAAMTQTFEFESDKNVSPGSKVLVDNVVYRVINKTITRGKYKYSATLETAMRDFNLRFPGSNTIASFNTRWGAGRKMRQASVEPLREN